MTSLIDILIHTLLTSESTSSVIPLFFKLILTSCVNVVSRGRRPCYKIGPSVISVSCAGPIKINVVMLCHNKRWQQYAIWKRFLKQHQCHVLKGGGAPFLTLTTIFHFYISLFANNIKTYSSYFEVYISMRKKFT